MRRALYSALLGGALVSSVSERAVPAEVYDRGVVVRKWSELSEDQVRRYMISVDIQGLQHPIEVSPQTFSFLIEDTVIEVVCTAYRTGVDERRCNSGWKVRNEMRTASHDDE